MIIQKFSFKDIYFDSNIISLVQTKELPIFCSSFRNLCTTLNLYYYCDKKMDTKLIDRLKSFLDIKENTNGKGYIIYGIIDKTSDSFISAKETYTELFLYTCEEIFKYIKLELNKEVHGSIVVGSLDIGEEIDLFNSKYLRLRLNNIFSDKKDLDKVLHFYSITSGIFKDLIKFSLNFMEKNSLIRYKDVQIMYKGRITREIDQETVIEDDKRLLLIPQAKKLAIREFNKKYEKNHKSYYTIKPSNRGIFWDMVNKYLEESLGEEYDFNVREYHSGYKITFSDLSKKVLEQIPNKEIEDFTNKIKLNILSSTRVKDLLDKDDIKKLEEIVNISSMSNSTNVDISDLQRIERSRFSQRERENFLRDYIMVSKYEGEEWEETEEEIERSKKELEMIEELKLL